MLPLKIHKVMIDWPLRVLGSCGEVEGNRRAGLLTSEPRHLRVVAEFQVTTP